MRYELLVPLLIIGLFFGLLGGIMAFVNSYEGYSHFPMLGKRRKWSMSLSIGFAAMVFILLAAFTVVLFIGYITD